MDDSDHQQEIEQDIETRLQHTDQLKQTVSSSPLINRLKAEGLI